MGIPGTIDKVEEENLTPLFMREGTTRSCLLFNRTADKCYILRQWLQHKVPDYLKICYLRYAELSEVLTIRLWIIITQRENLILLLFKIDIIFKLFF